MTGFVRLLVRRLLAEERAGAGPRLSRNRHFEVFADDQGRRAHRLYRRLLGLVRDLRAVDPTHVAVERPPGSDRVRLRIPLPRGVRTAYLSEDELQLLLESAGLNGRLAI
jgi:hypothetical protein